MLKGVGFLDATLDISGLEELLVKDDLIVPALFDDLKKFSQEQISVFCHKYAIYQVPTYELMGFLKGELGSNRATEAIEIGAGNGVFGRYLGIRMVDNKMQEWPDIKAYYENFSQPTITYGKDIETLAANDAVVLYKPKTVMACWVTQTYDMTKPIDELQEGNPHGIDEIKMFEDGVEKYIHIGNSITHGRKRILDKIPHRKIKADWLVSRSMSREENVIYLFEKE